MTRLGEVAVAGIECPSCYSPPGEQCRVTRGRNAGESVSYVHAARVQPVMDGWQLGYREGMRDQASLIRDRLEGRTMLTPEKVTEVTAVGYP